MIACRYRESALSQNGSEDDAPLGDVFFIMFVTSLMMSLSDRIYSKGLYPSDLSGSIRLKEITRYP